MNIPNLAKVELHLHLDCSLSFEVVSHLNPTITKEAYARDFIAPTKCTNLADFLKHTPPSIQLMQSEHNLRLVVKDLFKQLQQDNVIYVEIRFAPLLHIEGNLLAQDVVEIVEDETTKTSKITGIEARLILCTLRHFNQAQSLQTVSLLQQFQGSRVVALDLAADEAGFPLDNHLAAFQYAIAHNIPRTAHAGEAKGPESVWETLKQLKPTRIGHGVRSIEDPNLITHLKKHNIHLEVCPSCNVQINIYNTYSHHPVNRLYQDGLSVGINTDTRTLTNVTLNQEYTRLHQTYKWNKTHFLNCNLNALNASFLPADTKQYLKQRLIESYKD